ncbi:amidase [Rhodospirillum sp. A1_3_36]|uniref:amidase n=1 Tax=Rhodospirillum sp. A1_3_36 TaxID=3391666 RepID=UPI0039A59B4D
MSEDLIHLSAVDAVAALKTGEVSPLDLLDAQEKRIAAVDGAVNALPTRCFDRARKRAKALMARAGNLDPTSPGWLAGLPIAVKDMNPVAGVRTTFGSPIYANHVPTRSDVMVSTLERHGALVSAKSNTPEFAAGAHTFNDVFGATKNPWDLSKSCGGSSGGSAVALATGMAWLATGSDLGGSLRIPAAFNGVVGLRPSPGRVAQGPLADPFSPLSMEGPMGRSLADCALMLDAMAGRDPLDPLSRDAPAHSFLSAAQRQSLPRRVAWSADLNVTPMAAVQREVAEAATRRFGGLGADLVEARLDLSDAMACFQTLRAVQFATAMAPLLEKHRDRLKPEVVWNIEKGLALSVDEVARANRTRARIVQRMARLFETVDVLATPTTCVPPFPLEHRYVEEVEGQTLATYVDWLAITFAITVTGCPALSLPAGLTPEGLPVGLQLVGRPGGEAALLSHAAALEADIGFFRSLPMTPET